MKAKKRCTRKECKDRISYLTERGKYVASQRDEIARLQGEIIKLKEIKHEDMERMRARTELMKAIGGLSKTASSALWSDRKSAWGPEK